MGSLLSVVSSLRSGKISEKEISKTRGPQGVWGQHELSRDVRWGGGGYSVLSLKVRQSAVKADGPGLSFIEFICM